MPLQKTIQLVHLQNKKNKIMNLSKNFTLEEMCVTHANIANRPTQDNINNLGLLVREVLQPLRDLVGFSIHVNSGFRSPLVNKSVGGVPTSQHVKGQAADIVSQNNKLLFDTIHEELLFDQLINEHDYSWIHVSYKSQGNRNEVLELRDGQYIKI